MKKEVINYEYLRMMRNKRHNAKKVRKIVLLLMVALILSAVSCGMINDNLRDENFVKVVATNYNGMTTSKDISEVSKANTNEQVAKAKEAEEEAKQYQGYNVVKSNDEMEMLAKLVMAEIGYCSMPCKEAVVACIFNRVKSGKFPDTITEVITQKSGNVYQFSPLGDGRYEKMEPTEEVYQAINNVTTSKEDKYNGVLYFESCANADNWHSRNLTHLFTYDGVRFYK